MKQPDRFGLEATLISKQMEWRRVKLVLIRDTTCAARTVQERRGNVLVCLGCHSRVRRQWSVQPSFLELLKREATDAVVRNELDRLL